MEVFSPKVSFLS